MTARRALVVSTYIVLGMIVFVLWRHHGFWVAALIPTTFFLGLSKGVSDSRVQCMREVRLWRKVGEDWREALESTSKRSVPEDIWTGGSEPPWLRGRDEAIRHTRDAFDLLQRIGGNDR